ncbi:MAG TPA: efflux RND transporter periplasmic adaptor subunit, partial [Burkholderiaceae bacterium]
LWDRDQKTRLATGKLETVDNAIDTTTGTIKAKASFANADSALFPNQFVNAVLQVDTLPGVLTIPTTAVQRGSQGTYVYALKDDKTVTVRRIRLGVTDGDRVSVHGDLAEGEHVVTDGADRLREGAQVAVIAPDAAAKADQAVQDAASRPRGGNGAAMMRNLPPDVAAKVQAMSPEERRAYFRKLREQNGGAPGAGTASPGTGGNAGGSTGSGASGGEGHERRQPPAEGTERRQRASGAEAPAAAPAAGAATSR